MSDSTADTAAAVTPEPVKLRLPWGLILGVSTIGGLVAIWALPDVKTALTTTVQGVTSEVIFDGHYYYARQPSGDWIKTDAAAAAGASAPSNPGDLDAAYRSSEKSFKSVTYVGQQTIDGVEAAHYTVEADMAALGGTDSESEQSMTMDVYLDAQKRPVRLEQKSDATQVPLVQGKFNEPVTITIPADAKEA